MFFPGDGEEMKRDEKEALFLLLLSPPLHSFAILLADVGSLTTALRALRPEGPGIPEATREKLSAAGYGPERMPLFEVVSEALMGLRLSIHVKRRREPLQTVASSFGVTFEGARRCLERFEEFNRETPSSRKALRPCLRL